MPQPLSSLSVGRKVYDPANEKYRWIWTIVDQNHTGYPANSTTLMYSTTLSGDYYIYDEPETTRPGDFKTTNAYTQRQSYGNNRYKYANIRQWLNSDGAEGAWYTAQHAYDSGPKEYVGEAGFLTKFSAAFRAALLPTVLDCQLAEADGGGTEQVTDYMFLPSCRELNDVNYESDADEGGPFAGVISNSVLAAANRIYWTRSPSVDTGDEIRAMDTNGYTELKSANAKNVYVRPCCNLPATTLVSDSPDDNGYYSIIWNEAPNVPETIAVQGTVFSGKKTYVAWSASTDPEGEEVTYVLERSDNSASYVEVYRGAVNNYADTVPETAETAQWRVKALDTAGNESGYIATETLPVSHNKAPVITGNTGNLGNYSAPFSYPYTVTDPESDAVIVTEAIDGLELRRTAVVLGEENRMEVEGAAWLRLAAGQHTLTITATDSAGAVSTLTATFTRLVDSLEMTLAEDGIIACDSQPSRMTIEVSRDLAPGADLMVEVCNNAYDDSPTWETATGAALSGLAHVFTNTTKTAGKWGVNIRVTVKRNGATGNCRIYGIGGNVE